MLKWDTLRTIKEKRKQYSFLTFYQEQDGNIKVPLKLLTVYKWQNGLSMHLSINLFTDMERAIYWIYN